MLKTDVLTYFSPAYLIPDSVWVGPIICASRIGEAVQGALFDIIAAADIDLTRYESFEIQQTTRGFDDFQLVGLRPESEKEAATRIARDSGKEARAKKRREAALAKAEADKRKIELLIAKLRQKSK